MAHGFQWIPKRRTALPPDPYPRCGSCRARLDGLKYLHTCKETIPQSMPSPNHFIPLWSMESSWSVITHKEDRVLRR